MTLPGDVMTLEMLLILSLAINCLSLSLSFYTIRRIKKIIKLSSLIYDQLVIMRPVGQDPLETAFDFKQSLSKHLALTQAVEDTDPLLVHCAQSPAAEMPGEDPTSKVITKAESHLVKVLQAKYAIKDEDGPHPAGH